MAAVFLLKQTAETEKKAGSFTLPAFLYTIRDSNPRHPD